MSVIKNTRIEFTLREGLTKSDITVMATRAVDDVLEKGNVLQIAEVLAAMETFIKGVKADPRFPDYTRDELAKNGGKITTASGAKIEACETGTKYHFEKCNDPMLADLHGRIAELELQAKEREAFLKTVPEAGMDLRIGDELVTVYRPYKTSTSSYKVTLSK